MNDPTTLALIGTALIALGWVAIEWWLSWRWSRDAARWQHEHRARRRPRGEP